ncbi:MAG TPA: hypothetical protein GX404_05665 [Syntrophomonadaceae bacterium]|nr:hypothetical protein [Syntrophomonadaceae bacterium]
MRNVLKTMKNRFKRREHKITRGLVISATIGAWAVLVVIILWFLASIGWYLLAQLWRQELFVPGAVLSTVTAGLITLFWAILLSGSALLWTRYHYQHYYKHNRRQLSPLIMQPEQRPGQEWFLDNTSSSAVALINNEAASTSENTASPQKRYPHGSLIMNKELQEDFRDKRGKIVLPQGEVITPQIIEAITASQLYGQFVLHLSQQALDTIQERR